MSWFSFSRNRTESVALIDVGSSSVGGALAHFSDGVPVIYYTARVPLTAPAGKSLEDSLLTGLGELTALLLTEGAPILQRRTGSGRIDRAQVSVSAPWQNTRVRVHTIQNKESFTFTRRLMEHATVEETKVPAGCVSAGESVVATLLNGYETNQPFGKKVNRADLIILSSCLVEDVTDRVRKVLRGSFHLHDVSFTGFAPIAYSVLRDLYPHQKDFLVVDVGGEATDSLLVKRGLMMEVTSIPLGLHHLLRAAKKSGIAASPASIVDGMVDAGRNAVFAAHVGKAQSDWLVGLKKIFSDFAARQPLPRTIFLLSDSGGRDYLRRLLDDATIRQLWLSDDPLTIIPVEPSHFTPFLTLEDTAEADHSLALLALYTARLRQPAASA